MPENALPLERAASAALFCALRQIFAEADEAGDGFCRSHEETFAHVEPDAFAGVENFEEVFLAIEGQVAVAGRVAPGVPCDGVLARP